MDIIVPVQETVCYPDNGDLNNGKDKPTIELRNALPQVNIHHKYRLLTAAAVLLALLLTLLPAQDKGRLGMPEPWSYELAADQLAQGNWHLDDAQMTAARTRVVLAGAQLTQYVPVAPDWWALRQSPGHTLEMAALVLAGAPRLTNSVLASLAVMALYPALAAWHDERTAFLGIALFLFSPMSLLALHYTSMDTFSGGVWPLIAGALLLWYASSKQDSPRQAWLLLLAGFAIGWATVVRQTNVLLSGVLAAFFLYLLWTKFRAPAVENAARRRPALAAWPHLLFFGSGVLVAVGILAFYNAMTFGHPLANGYFYPSPYNQHNLWSAEPLTRVPTGVDTWLAGGTAWDLLGTLFFHLRLWLRPATLGWPLWPLALVGLGLSLRRRWAPAVSWFLLCWLLSVYVFYAGVIFFGVTRALTASGGQGWGFFIPARYLYPLILPFVWVLAGLLSRWPQRLSYALVGMYAVGSAGLFLATLAR